MLMEVRRVGRIHGSMRPPSDKSLTHRAYMLAAIASGDSIVRAPLRAADCDSTLRCLNLMGLRHEWLDSETVRLMPTSAWNSPKSALDCGNSGTTMRLLAGLVASRPIEAEFVGDASLSSRPMGRIAEPLRLMGAKISAERAPFRIEGGSLKGIRYETPVPSAQIKSCILLAGLRADSTTTVIEGSKSRDHTERMLASMGARIIESEPNELTIEPCGSLEAFEFRVPADVSSAAFAMCAAAMIPGSEVQLEAVGVNPTRTGVLEVFGQVGIDVEYQDARHELGEPVADLTVRGTGRLDPFSIEGSLVPKLIDEIPVLAVLATQCEGVSTIRDAGELRVKESDRIVAVANGLRSMGAKVETHEDGLTIEGPVQLMGARIDARQDHRIAMAFAVAGLIADGSTRIDGAEAIETSYPDFERDMARLSDA